MESEEAVAQFVSVVHAVLRAHPEAVTEFDECISRRDYRGAYVIAEKTMQINQICFTAEQDRVAERFFAYFVY